MLRGSDNSIKLNAYFKRQMTRLDDIIIDLVDDGQDATFEKVESKYHNNNSNDFIPWAFAELQNQKGIIRHSTCKLYEHKLGVRKKYKSEIPFNIIDHSFLTAYKYHVASVLMRKTNGYYQDFACIKKFFRIAVINSYLRMQNRCNQQ